MRTFFIQLFLSFWVATIGIFIGAALFFPNGDPGPGENMRIASAVSMQKLTEEIAQRYRTQGCAGVATLGVQFMLADEDGRLLCHASQRDEPEIREMLSQAATTSLIGRHVGAEWVQIASFERESEGRWFLIQRTPYVSRPVWPPLPKSAIPVSIFVTFLFAYLITRPIRTLSKAFRQFAAGDLSTRLPITPRRWGDVGGADVRTLMLDFNHMADRINDLLEAQKLLVRDISHELRSPLTRLRVALELAREESLEPLPWLDSVDRQVDRVNGLIGQMLTLSLIESIRKTPQQHHFSLSNLFDDLLPDMDFEAQAQDCSLLYSAIAADITVPGEQELLRRAIENVIRNAIRYTPPGGTVEIDVGRQTDMSRNKGYHDATSLLTIAVRDQGPGVPESSLPNVFRPFYRVDMAREDSTGGFGLGLAIAERAIQIHSGQIAAANRREGGLQVTISLPILEESVDLS